MSHNITVEGGTSVRLKTAGKYCDRDIVVTARGGAVEDLGDVLTEQELLIDELKEVLANKAASGGSGNSVIDFLAGTVKEIIDTNGVVTSLNQYAFYENDGIEIVRLPAVTSIGAYNFRACSNLTTIDLPEMTGSTGTYFGTSSTKLVNVHIPKATALGQYSMRYCGNLEYLDLPMVTSIANYSMAACSKLKVLILRSSDGVVTNSGTTTLTGTAISNGTGYIYVPSALVEEYKGATNWSKFANQIRAIEDYPEIRGG